MKLKLEVIDYDAMSWFFVHELNLMQVYCTDMQRFCFFVGQFWEDVGRESPRNGGNPAGRSAGTSWCSLVVTDGRAMMNLHPPQQQQQSTLSELCGRPAFAILSTVPTACFAFVLCCQLL